MRRAGIAADAPTELTAIKAAHTLVWALLAGCVVAIPVASVGEHHRLALRLAAVVAVEAGVLGCNRGRCPLTSLAARYTDDRSDNFDIYLPPRLAKHNKVIFGSLYVLGTAFAILRWAQTSA